MFELVEMTFLKLLCVSLNHAHRIELRQDAQFSLIWLGSLIKLKDAAVLLIVNLAVIFFKFIQ